MVVNPLCLQLKTLETKRLRHQPHPFVAQLDLHQETLAREVPPQRDAVRASQGTAATRVAQAICLTRASTQQNFSLETFDVGKTTI